MNIIYFEWFSEIPANFTGAAIGIGGHPNNNTYYYVNGNEIDIPSELKHRSEIERYIEHYEDMKNFK